MEEYLPKGWVKSEIGKIFSIITGNTPSKKYPEYYGNEIPWVKPADINRNIVLVESEEYLSNLGSTKARMLPVGAVMVTCIGNLGYVAIAGKTCATNQQINSIVDKTGKFNNKFIYYFSLRLKPWLTENSTSTTISMVNKSVFSKAPIFFPPRPEQDRIVAKVDVLMAQVATMQKSLERIPQLLKDFRQQVLTQAVTGKLTDVKVIENKLGDLLEDVKYGTSKKSLYEVEGTPILRIPNIKQGEIDDTDLKFSNLDDKEFEKLKLQVGDVLIIRSNGSVSIVGQSAIIRDKHIDYSYAGYLIRLRCKESLDPEFLNYSLLSNFLRTQIVESARSTSGVNNINSTEIKGLMILIPETIEEQKEIVRRIESLFKQADNIEGKYQTLKTKIDSLPQSILHKAFKGELVEQLPTDGDAADLLMEIEGLKMIKAK
ncbi:restriction endonuclease subunit S [Zobellia sp. 1_MG-2023]|uniref:restriction endonuclease subunit S n=1 Tax=Zobellia sp. 1_MG-2023 TaxID=3062626 RepID=UPI0026E150A4|nr:restriction endonuclease subunit S [Zobellia sp. 1_MG-2023]MDO6818913.1 restriction endonuclease subunit S [Zobellia sp. 1_MG-2023]